MVGDSLWMIMNFHQNVNLNLIKNKKENLEYIKKEGQIEHNLY